MKRFSVSQARNNLPMLINQAKKEPIMIERHEKEAAVLISVEQFEKFKQQQDLRKEKIQENRKNEKELKGSKLEEKTEDEL